jgi:tRNA(fMet)-specific endonuclease VapC
MTHLFDSNAVIALMARQAVIERRVLASEPATIVLSSIVLFELMFGAFNSLRVETNLDRLADLALPLIEFDGDDARAAGEVRAALKRLGTPIGPYDVLIAGQALARGLIVVTANTGEFSRVAGVCVENWLID